MHCWFEYLVGALMSTSAVEDVRKLNPFLDASRCQSLLEGVVVVLLTTMRLGQASLCLAELDSVVGIIRKLASSRTVDLWNAVPDRASLVVTKGMLHSALVAAKYHPAHAVSQLQQLADDVMQLQQLPSLSGAAAASTAGFVYQLARYDKAAAAAQLSSPQEFVAVLDKARRGCFHEGTKLPNPARIKTGLLQRDSTSSAALVHMLDHTSTHLADLLASARHFIVPDASFGVDSGVLAYDPRFLVFEFLFGYMLRRRQVEIVNQFIDSHGQGQSCVRQMIMGAGKTSVVGPLLALMLADGQSLVTLVVPYQLLVQSRLNMRAAFSAVIMKRVYTLEFDRSAKSSSSVQHLQALVEKMDRARHERAIVCATPETVKSVMLKYLDLLNSVNLADPKVYVPPSSLPKKDQTVALQAATQLHEYECAADELAKLVRLWGPEGRGVLLLDEVDQLLHPLRSELNFPTGPKVPLELKEIRWELPMYLTDGVFYATRGRTSVSNAPITAAGEAALQAIKAAITKGVKSRSVMLVPHVVVLRPDFYFSDLKDPLAAWLLEYLLRRHDVRTVLGERSADGHLVLNDEVKLAIGNYIKGARTNSISAMYLGHRCGPDVLKLLNLCRDWINVFMPHCLAKIDRVSYGLLRDADQRKAKIRAAGEGAKHEPRTRLELAVPFVGKDVPSKSAEFAHQDVLIGMTILAYRYEGMRMGDLRETVKDLKKAMLNESGRIQDRKSYRLFHEWLAVRVCVCVCVCVCCYRLRAARFSTLTLCLQRAVEGTELAGVTMDALRAQLGSEAVDGDAAGAGVGAGAGAASAEATGTGELAAPRVKTTVPRWDLNTFQPEDDKQMTVREPCNCQLMAVVLTGVAPCRNCTKYSVAPPR